MFLLYQFDSICVSGSLHKIEIDDGLSIRIFRLLTIWNVNQSILDTGY